MRVVTETIQRTYCECGAELHSADEWSQHRRRHTIEYHASTPEGRRTLEMLRGMGFKDEPDQLSTEHPCHSPIYA